MKNTDLSSNQFIIPRKIIAVNTIRLVDQMLWTVGSLDRFISGFNPKAVIGKLIFPHSRFNFKEDCSKKFNKENFPISFSIMI